MEAFCFCLSSPVVLIVNGSGSNVLKYKLWCTLCGLWELTTSLWFPFIFSHLWYRKDSLKTFWYFSFNKSYVILASDPPDPFQRISACRFNALQKNMADRVAAMVWCRMKHHSCLVVGVEVSVSVGCITHGKAGHVEIWLSSAAT